MFLIDKRPYISDDTKAKQSESFDPKDFAVSNINKNDCHFL